MRHASSRVNVLRFLICAAVPLCFALVGQAVSAESPDWNQWRGPTRDSMIADAKWPDKLNEKLSLVWEKEHSPTYSGPIVSGDLVFTTETIDKKSERVTAYKLASGEVSWTREWDGAMSVPFFAAANGDWIRATPVCNKDVLIVLGMRDVMTCLDVKTGADKWRVDFPKDMATPLPSFGAASSPLIEGDAVYVQTGGAVVKLSLADGSVVWKTLENGKGMMSSGAFSSPVVATIAGKKQMVVQTREALCGVDLDTGAVMWKQPIQAFRGMNILTPLVIGDRLFTSAHSGKAQLFEVTRADDKWSIEELWVQKLQAYMSSPVLNKDSIYRHMKNQRVAAINVGDGSIKWTSSPFGKYWSMVSNGKHILALDNKGELLLIEPNDEELKIVDRMKVAADSWAHLAVQGDMVVVRDLKALKVYRWK